MTEQLSRRRRERECSHEFVASDLWEDPFSQLESMSGVSPPAETA